MPTASWSEPNLGSKSLALNIISKIAAREHSKSELTLKANIIYNSNRIERIATNK